MPNVKKYHPLQLDAAYDNQGSANMHSIFAVLALKLFFSVPWSTRKI